jgi:hypothetical protein
MRWLAFLALVGLAATSALAAQAQDKKPSSCVHAPAILAAADFLLVEPAAKPNFWRDREGDDAAYLKIRYGDLPYPEASQFLAGLEKRSHPPQRVLELKVAHAKAVDRAAMLAEIEPQPNIGSIVPLLGESAWRALAVEDGGDWLLGELKRWKAANPDRFDQSPVHRQLPMALLDLDDGAKTQIARRAEEAGLTMLAFNLYASKQDLSDFLGFIGRNPPPGGGLSPSEQRASAIRFALTIAEQQAGFDTAKQPAEIRAVEVKRGYGVMMRPFLRLARQFPPAAMLMTVLNQTGELRIGTEVAAGILAEIDAEKLDPANKPDVVFAAMVEGLDRVLGREVRERQLASFNTIAAGQQNETAAAVADRALARLALAPFVAGDASEAPPRPQALTEEFPWEQWTSLAKSLHDKAALGDGNGLIAADLLAGADRAAEAVVLLQADPELQTAKRRAHALLHALDRRCNDLLRHPAPLSETLYRFDAR